MKSVVTRLFFVCGIFVLIFGLFSITSCENFLNGAELKKELETIIEYENTPDVVVKISANSLFGTLTAETGGSYKIGRSHKLAIQTEDNYQFCSWNVYNEKEELVSCTKKDDIYIADATNPVTTFEIKQNISGYKIVANCQLRPSVSIATPQFQSAGVNRDRDIILNFNMEIDSSNFRYTEEEVNQLKKAGNNFDNYRDADGKAYGYCTKNGIVYYKNIKIRNENNSSENLLEFFGIPEINGSKLIISPKKGIENHFELDSNGLKDIKVTISNLVNNNGIKMFKDYEYSYRVSENTDSQTKVTIQNESSMGKLVSSGSGKYSVGAEINLSFTENDNYKFITFNIEESNTSRVTAALTSCSYDSFKGTCEAVVTILDGDGDIVITTECVPRPVIKSYSPSYMAVGSTFDSNIVINFGAPVATDSFIYSDQELDSFGSTAVAVKNESNEVIAIDVAGKRYFKNISLVDNQNKNISNHYNKLTLSEDGQSLTIYFDSSRLFDFGDSSTKDIYVTLNPSVYSEYKNNGVTEKVLLSDKLESQDFSFRVRNASEAKAKIFFSALDSSISPASNMGILNYNEAQEFNLGQKVTVNFTPTAAYDFIKWSVTGDTDGSLLFEGDKTSTTLVFTVVGAAEGITIKPYCEKLNTSRLLFSTPSGTISPSGYVNVRRNETIDLICKVSEKYCFAKWKVVNTVSGKDLSEEKYKKYFEFGDIKNPETSVKVLFDSKNLSIVADTYLRPAIYDHDPINQIAGTDRDQAIRIFITPGIDEKTLYYTEAEKADLEKQGYTVLDAGNLKNHKYYGYWIKNDYDSIVYKNVKITNRADVNENLLRHYGAPYIQDEKGTVVVIPPNKDKLPPEYKEILVTLGTEYGYYSDDEDEATVIGLYDNNLIFSYKTNEKTDKTVPEFNKISLEGKLNSDTKLEILPCETEPDIPASGEFDYDIYKNYYIKPEEDGSIKFDFDIHFSDAGMNLNSLSMCMAAVRDNEYKEPPMILPLEKVLPFKSSSTDGWFTDEVVFSDYLSADGSIDGLYKIWFIARDLAGNETSTENTGFFYVLIDRAAPHLINDENFVYYKKNGSVKIENVVKAREGDTVETYVQFQNNPEIEITDICSVECSGLEKLQEAKFKITTKDVFGNTHTYDSSYNKKFTIETVVKYAMFMYKDGYFSETATNKDDICGLVVTVDSSGENDKIGVILKETYTATLEDLEAGRLPVPALTGVLAGNTSYRIPDVDIWKNKIGIASNESNRVTTYTKFEEMGNSLNIPGCEAYYYVANGDGYVLYNASRYSLYLPFSTFYYSIKSKTDNNFIKYLVTYEDTAE